MEMYDAYFQRELLDRVLSYEPPESGLADPQDEDVETMILARVPSYGSQDSGRMFWNRFPRVIFDHIVRVNKKTS